MDKLIVGKAKSTDIYGWLLSPREKVTGEDEAEDFTQRCSAAPFLPAPKAITGPSKDFSCFHHKNHSKSLPQEQILKTLGKTGMPKVFALHQQGEAPTCTHPAPERLTQLLMMDKAK